MKKLNSKSLDLPRIEGALTSLLEAYFVENIEINASEKE